MVYKHNNGTYFFHFQPPIENEYIMCSLYYLFSLSRYIGCPKKTQQHCLYRCFVRSDINTKNKQSHSDEIVRIMNNVAILIRVYHYYSIKCSIYALL